MKLPVPLALLALAACATPPPPIPSAPADTPRLAALASAEASAELAGVTWSAEAARSSALWARAASLCVHAERAAFDGSPALPNCRPVLEVLDATYVATVERWKALLSPLPAARRVPKVAPAAAGRLEPAEAFAALEEAATAPAIFALEPWREEARTFSPLWGAAVERCAAPSAQPRPNCAPVLLVAVQTFGAHFQARLMNTLSTLPDPAPLSSPGAAPTGGGPP
ncbi:MAG: hypothetical protein F9K18_03405 [Thermoanaerobaculia bacterium]|nr:MAG: hypothetical protein F9K18_03405 [Thermoanaerobaculia bacterium]MBZ0101014.1 hypothetical protein [Thermoanaerobaculia bacterium]